MSVLTLKQFQQDAVDSAVGVFAYMRDVLNKAGENDDARATAIHDNGYLLIEAPTGCGKTLMAGNVVERVSGADRVVWFWFAPFKGVVDQSASFLREQFQGLRLRTLADDRNPIGTQSGDVFVTTWQSVATRIKDRRSVRVTGEQQASIDDLVADLRDQGFRLGVVIDEAHHTFKGDNQAAIFYRTILKPDYTVLVTATPDDKDLDDLKTRMQIRHIHKVSVSRADATGKNEAEGLIKRGIKAIAWRVPEETDAWVDFEKTALRGATELHQFLKSELLRAGINLTPLMLVQVDSKGKSTDRAREYLTKLGFADSQIATHTADEPDASLMALANNEQVEVLIFKMAVALGFDAPRAWTLVSMRATQKEDFGVQLVGRILRVHRRLQGRVVPDALRYGYVLLADIESQSGLDKAGQRINQIKTQCATASPTMIMYVHGDDVMVQSPDDGTQLQFAPEPPPGVHFQIPPASIVDEMGNVDPDQLPLFAATFAPPELSRQLRAMVATKPTATKKHVYRLKNDCPQSFQTQRLDDADEVTEKEVAQRFVVNTQALVDAALANAPVSVQKRTIEIFTRQIQTEIDFAQPSSDEKAKAAQRTLLKYGTLSAKVLRTELAHAVHQMLVDGGFVVETSQATAHEVLNDLLCFRPYLLHDAYRRAIAAKAIVVAAESLPGEIDSDELLTSSRLNLYSCYPPQMNSWEVAFADKLDADDTDTVLWWHRNEPRKPWSINVLMATGDNFYPDFIVGIRDRPTHVNGLLADTKEAYMRTKELPKLAAAHQSYGRVLILTRDNPKQIWQIASWDTNYEKPTISGNFQVREAAGY